MNEPPARSFWQRHRTALLISVLALAGLCAVFIGLAVFPSTPVITPAQEQLARQAIQNPDSATLHLGHHGDIEGWYSPGPNDYAVEGGMVIFPAPTSGISLISNSTIGDLTKPVVVYAPDGSDLAGRPGLPFDRSWFYGNEWYLYNCRPIATPPLWWSCTLLVGFNI